MRPLDKKFRVALSCAALLIWSAGRLNADSLAFMTTGSGDFGTINLNTGVFSVLSNSGQILAGLGVFNGALFATNYHMPTGTLYRVNPANGSLTKIGDSSISYNDFGSTLNGLFAVDQAANLYSVNPSTGAVTLLGPTGVSLQFGFSGLSTNSSTLYLTDGVQFYRVNTTTGQATLIGGTGGLSIGALVLTGGILYGGVDLPATAVATINPNTGSAIVGPPLTGTLGTFFGLAPNPLPSVVLPPTFTKSFSLPFDESFVVPGGTAELVLTITNPNTTTNLSGVTFIDNLPPGLVIASPRKVSRP